MTKNSSFQGRFVSTVVVLWRRGTCWC